MYNLRSQWAPRSSPRGFGNRGNSLKSRLKHIKGILIEVNNNFHEQAKESQLALSQAGLTQVEKHHSDMIANTNLGLHNTFNQIWSRY